MQRSACVMAMLPAMLVAMAACGDQLPTGPIIYCWDTDRNEECTLPAEDVDGNGLCDVGDCRGAPGGEGPPGVAGGAGPAGPAGPPGDPGVAGPVGPVGLACWDLDGDGTCAALVEDLDGDGVCDAADCRGPAGVTGPQGDVGPIGPAGPIGLTGDVGPAGAAGPAGPQGDVGLVGPAGVAGPIGATGLACWDLDGDGVCNPLVEDNDGDNLCTANDCVGPAGPQGIAGPEGPRGIQGPAGAAGPVGPAGPQGDPGPQGAVGAVGPVGPVGPQGDPGPQGPAGLDGSPDTPSQILAKLLGVDGTGSGIDADRLDGIDSATLLARLDALDTAVAALAAPVQVLGATVFTSGGAVSYAGKTGAAAVRQVCLDEYGPGTRACSYADVVDAIAAGNVPAAFTATVWSTRDLVFDVDLGPSPGCRAMTLAAASGVALAITTTDVDANLESCDNTSGGPTLAFTCCIGH